MSVAAILTDGQGAVRVHLTASKIRETDGVGFPGRGLLYGCRSRCPCDARNTLSDILLHLDLPDGGSFGCYRRDEPRVACCSILLSFLQG